MDRSPATQGARTRQLAIAALLAGLAGTAWLFAAAPAVLDFGLAVLAAFTWCFLLDRLRTDHDTQPVPGPDGGVSLTRRPSTTVSEVDARAAHEERASIKAA